ncbi:Phosphoglucomutase [Mycoplasmopsis californica]|uniref:Phospho-sugar mutase n=1 Tax=Mycoplasmopsis equigenitalium TaxID=114883 RepID=A0ABY5J4J5_9BACT|nr:phospho-sugar mutase [Mycoplasmopsis equigenitalium]UUD37057.1 phospho-sugar mutase [Mycoplasmopsis equigenitalium]VEU69643.1 Phosphoglucomutase [Mycoplasmopsis californica]
MNKKLEFGTAGIRGIVGPAEHELNTAHVARIADGLVSYLKHNFKEKDRIVVIGRDNRIMSKEFAILTRNILSRNEIKVIFSEDISPTPFVSFLIKEYKAAAGVNITASHNPKEYNGVKVYNQFGYQSLPDEIDELLKYFKDYSEYLNFDLETKNDKFIKNVNQENINKYLEKVLKLAKKRDCNNISVAYSPLHGTGAKYVRYLLPKLSKNSYFLEAQMINDSNFSNVKSPNPENTETYEELIKLGLEKNADILLVTDPDSDRVGLCVKNNNKYELLTGNETATLIMNYLVETTKNLKNKYLIYSYVSSNVPRIIAEKNNIKVYETPTGYKWIGALIQDNKKTHPELEHLFSFEESYGSLIDETLAFDKDAIQSIVILTTIASYYKEKGLNLLDVLENIYKKYGYVASKVLNIGTEKYDLINLQKGFKNIKEKDSVFTDYNLDPQIPTNMLKIQFSDHSWIALRPSGTEPKIKFYIFGFGDNKEKADARATFLLDQIKKML